MPNLKTLLSEEFVRACEAVFATDLDVQAIQDSITRSTQPEFGHFQCNMAMRFAKQLSQSPRDIATKVSAALMPNLIERAEVAGPGFINIWLHTHTLTQACQLIADERCGVELASSPQRVIVDFSSPNIAKEMHVGHLRSTIIGDCLARVLSFLGHDVLRLNHIGDWGTAFGMLIVYLKREKPTVLTGDEPTQLSDLVVWYKAAKVCFDQDPDFKRESQAQVVSLQSGEKTALAAWQLICDISRIGFQPIYDVLDIRLVERGESFYNPFLQPLMDICREKNLLVESDGAQCMMLPGFKSRSGDPLPLMVQKSDGGFNYASTDLAAIRHRVDVEKTERIIYVTDSGQSLHFKMVFAGAKAAGFYTDHQLLQHVGFGLVLGEDGKKFRTRSGDTVRLQDLLDEAIERAYQILRQRQSFAEEDALRHAARALGIGAVKYADLSTNRINDYQFSFDRMLQFEGNTAAFILYSYVRIKSIERKMQLDFSTLAVSVLDVREPAEVELALQLSFFDATLQRLSRELTPHILTDYLYNLAQRFNAFFRDCRVEGSDYAMSRCVLCHLVAKVIKQGLALLGIETSERM